MLYKYEEARPLDSTSLRIDKLDFPKEYEVMIQIQDRKIQGNTD
jgi:hypothetical protein